MDVGELEELIKLQNNEHLKLNYSMAAQLNIYT